ncbi:MAG: signal peptidase I [Clostridiales bacterium]|nr:signal peptidase I [Clostridiales bacterium]
MDSNKRPGDSTEDQTDRDQPGNQENQTSDLARMLAERAARILSEDQPLPVDRLRTKPEAKPPEKPAGQAVPKKPEDNPAHAVQPGAGNASARPDAGAQAAPKTPAQSKSSEQPSAGAEGRGQQDVTAPSPAAQDASGTASPKAEHAENDAPTQKKPEKAAEKNRSKKRAGRRPSASDQSGAEPSSQPDAGGQAAPKEPDGPNQMEAPEKQLEKTEEHAAKTEPAPPREAQAQNPSGGQAPPVHPDGKPETPPEEKNPEHGGNAPRVQSGAEAESGTRDASDAQPEARDVQDASPDTDGQGAQAGAAVSVPQARQDGAAPEDGADEIPEGTKTVMAVYDLVQVFAQALFIITLLFVFVFRIAAVNGYSMEPTLDAGNWVVVSNFGFEVKRGEIVVISQPNMLNEPLIKRIIAVGGETIDIDEAGNVTIDGQVIDEPYIAEITRVRGDISLPHTVPEGYVFVMGDNRNKSGDSRYSYIGDIDERYLVGEAKLRLFPIGRHTIENRSVEYSIDTQNDGVSS